ncbi:MAG: peptide chain release factor 2 [Eubacteriales bacterium]|nr:peptide chain release factor 2 [Eubacteriales bacterium]MDY4897505.1 peptide chain release factor 2 [Eubacteriales bacterium]
MIALEDAKYKLLALRDDIKELGSALRIDELRNNVAELEKQTLDADFWNNQENSSRVLQTIKQTKDKIEGYDALHNRLEDAIALAEMAIEENDESSVPEVQAELEAINREKEERRIEILLSGEYDRNNAIISFHPGAGGTEAQDWAQMLYRMITRWAERHKYNVKLTDWLDGEEAGLKSATIMVEGINAYGYLKSEHGVHRLVRVSPFDASGRRHTSFASIEVMPEFDKLDDIVIRDEDYDFMPYHSSGAGGQNVNKVSSAVRILHKPTGIVVTCQTERSQLQNKETAMRMLKSKLMEIKIRERLDTIDEVRGVKTNIEWGNQIRSYVFMPYTLVKDTRTGYEDGNITAVMDGEIDGFINAYLKMTAK